MDSGRGAQLDFGAASRKGIPAPSITNIRKAPKGKTYRRGMTETRGRKRTLSPHVVRHMNQKGRSLIRTAGGNCEAGWKDVIRKSRAPKVHRITALRAFRREKLNVGARRPRVKPQRTKAQPGARVEACKVLSVRRPALAEHAFAPRRDGKTLARRRVLQARRWQDVGKTSPRPRKTGKTF